MCIRDSSEAFSADADGQRIGHSVEHINECTPDSEAAQPTEEIPASSQQALAAAVTPIASSPSEYTNTLYSLVTQLKSAVSAAHSGNRVSCLCSDFYGAFLC